MTSQHGTDASDRSTLGKCVSDFHHNRVCKILADHGGTVVIGNG